MLAPGTSSGHTPASGYLWAKSPSCSRSQSWKIFLSGHRNRWYPVKCWNLTRRYRCPFKCYRRSRSLARLSVEQYEKVHEFSVSIRIPRRQSPQLHYTYYFDLAYMHLKTYRASFLSYRNSMYSAVSSLFFLNLSYLVSSYPTDSLQLSRTLPPKRTDEVQSWPPLLRSVLGPLTTKSKLYLKSLSCRTASPLSQVFRWTQNRLPLMSITQFPCFNPTRMTQQLRFVNFLMRSRLLLLITGMMVNRVLLPSSNVPEQSHLAMSKSVFHHHTLNSSFLNVSILRVQHRSSSQLFSRLCLVAWDTTSFIFSGWCLSCNIS